MARTSVIVAYKIAFALALSAVTALTASSQDALEATLEALSGDIRDVKSAGRWRTTESQGVYRVVVVRGGYEHIRDRLYIQWLSDATDDQSPRVLATVSVSEINDGGPFTFSHALYTDGTNRLRITVNARHTYTGARSEFVFIASAVGTYIERTKAERPNEKPRG